MSEELLPCPFCNSRALYYVDKKAANEGIIDHYVRCMTCEAKTSYSQNKEHALSKWNARSPAEDGGDLTFTGHAALSRPSVEAREIVELIDFLRKEEGSSVEILCDNPDFDGPANAIVLCNEHTGWINKRYSGDSVLDALRNAKQDIIHDKYVVVGKK